MYEHLEYFPFGETWIHQHTNTNQRLAYNFTGKELDESTGFYYFGARYFDPRANIWISPDPILGDYVAGQINGGVFSPENLGLFSYTFNNPVKFTDPDGRAGKWADGTYWDHDGENYDIEKMVFEKGYNRMGEAIARGWMYHPGLMVGTGGTGLAAKGVVQAAAKATAAKARARLRTRILALGDDPARGFIRAEGIGGVRIEKALGRTIRRSADEAADFVDDVLGPISLKGPIPSKGSVRGLAESAIKDAKYNTATKALFVDLRGLSAADRTLVRELVADGVGSAKKLIRFLD